MDDCIRRRGIRSRLGLVNGYGLGPGLSFPVIDAQIVSYGEDPGVESRFSRIEGVHFGQCAFEDGGSQIIGSIGIRSPVAEIFEYRRVIMIKLLANVDGLAGCG